MKKVFAALLIVTLVAGFAYAQAARGTDAEAKTLLDKAVAYYKAKGQAEAFKAFNDPKGQFVNKDLYIFALDLSGKVIAHGANATLIGKDLSKTPDADGKFFMNEMLNVAKTKGKGTVDYKWMNKATGKVEPKSSYVEKMPDNVVLGCGYYK